jgi:hypothetical protein
VQFHRPKIAVNFAAVNYRKQAVKEKLRVNISTQWAKITGQNGGPPCFQ